MITSVDLFILLTVQVAFTSAAVPLKCFLGDSEILDIFSKSSIPSSFYDYYKTNPIQLDPMKLGSVTVNQDKFQLITKDVEYTGFSNSIIDEFGINSKTNLTRIFFHSDIKGTGSYKISGSLFSVPVTGEGPFISYFNNLQIEMVMPYDIITDENGRRYVDLKTFYFWYQVSNNGEVNFINLYGGNKQLSEAMNSLINDNLRVFAHHFGQPYLTRIADHIFHVFRNYLLSMPLKDYSTC